MDAIIHRSVTAPRELNPQVSAGLDAVIRRALEKDPWRRYHSAREMRTELQRLSGAESSAPTDSPTLEHSQAPPMEIAHVLFRTDIVGYSSFPMGRAAKIASPLAIHRARDTGILSARSQDRLIPLPTGDGMTLVFFGEPESAARCALELGRKLRQVPELPLRMGAQFRPRISRRRYQCEPKCSRRRDQDLTTRHGLRRRRSYFAFPIGGGCFVPAERLEGAIARSRPGGSRAG